MNRSIEASLRGVLGAALLLVGGDAMAVVGRPATPGSVAGVARRTSRRTTAVVAGAAVASSYVYSLPTGCRSVTVNGIGYQQCGSTYYRPYYQGAELVYVIETP